MHPILWSILSIVSFLSSPLLLNLDFLLLFHCFVSEDLEYISKYMTRHKYMVNIVLPLNAEQASFMNAVKTYSSLF
jgi:hypothetical protein